MENLFEKIVIMPLEDSFQRLVKFLPNLLGALTVLILGVIFGWILELIIIKILKIIGDSKISLYPNYVELTES